MKLGEIKIAALKLMFDTSEEEIGVEDLARLYEDGNYGARLKAMPEAINRAVDQMSARRVLFSKTHDFAVFEVRNALPHAETLYGVLQHEAGDLVFTADSGRCFCFEVNGNAVVYVEIRTQDGWQAARRPADGAGEAEELQIIVESGEGFAACRGRIDNPEGLPVRLRFSGEYLYRVKGVAIYAAAFPTDSDVPLYTREKRYDLAGHVTDFYKLESLSREDGAGRYGKVSDYRMEGKDVLVLSRTGSYRAVYTPRPAPVSSGTPDEQELVMPEELARLIPYYVKADLYEEDDPAMAALSRNVFENRLADYLADNAEKNSAGPICDALGMGW